MVKNDVLLVLWCFQQVKIKIFNLSVVLSGVKRKTWNHGLHVVWASSDFFQNFYWLVWIYKFCTIFEGIRFLELFLCLLPCYSFYVQNKAMNIWTTLLCSIFSSVAASLQLYYPQLIMSGVLYEYKGHPAHILLGLLMLAWRSVASRDIFTKTCEQVRDMETE